MNVLLIQHNVFQTLIDDLLTPNPRYHFKFPERSNQKYWNLKLIKEIDNVKLKGYSSLTTYLGSYECNLNDSLRDSNEKEQHVRLLRAMIHGINGTELDSAALVQFIYGDATGYADYCTTKDPSSEEWRKFRQHQGRITILMVKNSDFYVYYPNRFYTQGIKMAQNFKPEKEHLLQVGHFKANFLRTVAYTITPSFFPKWF